MDPRFILHPTHVVDRSSARFLPPGTAFAGGHSPALLSSHLSPVQPFYTAYDQTLGVGEVAFSASVPSGQAYFRTDRLPPGTTVLQEVPNPEVGGVGYGLGPVNLGYRNVALTPLNNLQVAEIGPSAGVHSLIVPSYADVSGCGHGYGNSATVCVYQAYPQAQIHAGPALLPLSPLPSRQHMFLDQALDQEYGSLDQTNPPLRARRMEVDRIRKLERGRVLDQRRELQRKPDIQKASLKKQKAFLEKGVHASSPKGNTWCSICKVECQSAHVLQNHIEGKKHKLKLEAAKEIQGSLKKKSEDVIKEAVKSSKEKEVEVDSNHQQAVKTARTEKARRKRAQQRSSLAAKQQEGKAEKDGIADEAINKALLEIGKVGADFTVDRVYNELKTGDLDAEKPFKVVIKEAVKSSKEKEVEVDSNHQQAVKTAKTEKARRKRLRRAQQQRSLAAKQQEGKAEKDGIADEAINKALLEIGKVGADFTVDRVYNELKTGDLDADKPFKVVIKEAVKSSKEKEVEVDSNHQQAVKTAKTEKARRKRLRRAQQRRSLAAKQQEGKAEKDGIADEAINKALLEIGKVGADFTVDRVYNELKIGDLDAEKPFKVVIKEAVKSSKEKEVEVDSNHQQAVKTAKTEKARRKRLRRAQQRRSLAAKQQEGKAEKDGIADEAINKALLEIGKVGADFTVDRVYNELKTGDLDAEKPFKVEKVIAKIEVEADTPIGKVEGDAGATKMVILDGVQSISMDIRSKAQEDEEVFEEKLRHDKIESVKVTNDINSEEDKYVAGVDLPTEEKIRHDKIESVKVTNDINSEEDKYVAGVDLPTSGKKDVLGKRSREISGLSPTATPQKTSPVKSKKANVGSSLQSETVRCEVCAVTCRNETLYKSHSKGEKHAEWLKK